MPHKDPDVRREYARRWYKRRRAERREAIWAARRQRIANRAPIPLEDCIWAAGHFEGEGTVTLLRNHKSQRTRPYVTLSSTDQEVVQFFHARWPGQTRDYIPRSTSGNVRRCYRWGLNSGESIEAFLLDILPHVRTSRVRRKIEIVIEDIRDRKLYEQEPGTYERSSARRELIAALNLKGPNLALRYQGKDVPLLEGPKA